MHVQPFNLGVMKTIHKKQSTSKTSPKKASQQYLIDHPEAHELLSVNNSFVSDVIDLKDKRQRRNKSIASLTGSLSLCLSLLIVIWAFELRLPEDSSTVDLSGSSNRFDDLVEIPQTEQIQKPPVKAQVPNIIEVNDEEIIEEIEVDLDIEMTEQTRIEEVIVETEAEDMPEETVDEIFTIVEQQPAPVGGLNAFYNYVSQNLKYPPKASRMGIEGRVFVEFIVEKDGSLTDIKVVKGIGGGCDEEAIRVLSGAPNWLPGKQRGNPVRVRMVMPIMFKLLTH
jgi:protein TonB